MKKQFGGWILCGLLAGCGGAAPEPVVEQPPVAGTYDGPDEFCLAKLLQKSRAELAQEADELEKQIEQTEKLRLEGQLKFTLLSKARIPYLPAVWREARYSEKRGFSLPPYLKEDDKDTALALHLARHGDVEAAAKLAKEADDPNLKSHALNQNFPLEWTRLVSLRLHHAQVLLATGNVDGAKQLVSMHKQLRDLLTDKARASALASALMPRGLETLKQAADAWSATKPALAKETEACLAKFEAPVWQWRLSANRERLSTELGLVGANPGATAAQVLRVLDLAALPIPHRGAAAAIVFFDDAKLSELLIVYRPEAADYEHVGQFAPELAPLHERAPTVKVVLAPHHPLAGPLVQVSFAGGTTRNLPRDFGPLSLDRTFEHNRRLVAWKQRGSDLTVTDVRSLGDLKLPFQLAPKQVRFERDAQTDIVKNVEFQFAVDNRTTLAEAAKSCWEAFGPAKISASSGLQLTWDDGNTTYRLLAPALRDRPIVWEVTDSSGKDPAQRLAAAQARDTADRQTRLGAQQPLLRLPRNLDSFILGARKSDVERLIPASAARRDLSDGIMIVFTGAPKAGGDLTPREVFLRFNSQKELAEIRLRSFDAKPGAAPKKLEAIKAAHGPGEVLVSPAALTSDLPSRKSSGAHLAWQDDVTVLEVRTDPGCLEMTLRNCPLTHPAGEPLEPFSYLPRGPAEFSLGMSSSDALQRGAVPTGEVLMAQPKKGPFDSVLVWCEKEKATRIVARYRPDPAVLANPGKAVPETWAREARNVGWPWRQDFHGKTPQGWTTFDGQTRFRIFWEENNQGTHLLAEWRDLGR